MLDCWRTGGANSPETFITAVAAVLSRYPDEVVYAVTDPTRGLPLQLTWMPSVKEVHDACEKEMEPIYRRQREERLVAETLAARSADVDKSSRPTREEMQEKYGPNWGLKSLDRPERKPKPAPTAEELRQHYAKFKLAFEPKEST